MSVESSGDIETICTNTPVSVGDKVLLVFRAHDEATPPFKIKVKAPSGKVILDRVLRELPTGKPQSAAPVEFTASTAGKYGISIAQLYGKQAGEAILTVS